MEILKILYATDYSPASEPAFEIARSLARDNGAKLVILHVSHLEAAPVGELFDEEPAPPEAEEQRLKALVQQSGDIDCECRWRHCEPGHEADTIVETAQQEHADMIVVGTHGRHGLTHLLTGSVAEKVVRDAQCPVLAIRQAKPAVVET